MKAIRVNQLGGASVLQIEEIEKPEPKAGEALIRMKAAGSITRFIC
jgi:NADPH:quinone reductase-like Zn-dependent oxidoreductase